MYFRIRAGVALKLACNYIGLGAGLRKSYAGFATTDHQQVIGAIALIQLFFIVRAYWRMDI